MRGGECTKKCNCSGVEVGFQSQKRCIQQCGLIQGTSCHTGFFPSSRCQLFQHVAPMAFLASIQTVLAFSAAEDYETGQIDIKSAYLNGELTDEEVIFMKQAPRYEEASDEEGVKVYRLKKSLYGLKQAGHRWYQKLVEIMTKLRFKRCERKGNCRRS